MSKTTLQRRIQPVDGPAEGYVNEGRGASATVLAIVASVRRASGSGVATKERRRSHHAKIKTQKKSIKRPFDPSKFPNWKEETSIPPKTSYIIGGTAPLPASSADTAENSDVTSAGDRPQERMNRKRMDQADGEVHWVPSNVELPVSLRVQARNDVQGRAVRRSGCGVPG